MARLFYTKGAYYILQKSIFDILFKKQTYNNFIF